MIGAVFLRVLSYLAAIIVLVRGYNISENSNIANYESDLIPNVIEDVLVNSPDDLAWDDKNHLKEYYLLYSSSPQCKERVEATWQLDKNYIRILRPANMSTPLMESLTNHNTGMVESFFDGELCIVFNLVRGTPRRMIQEPVIDNFFIGLLQRQSSEQFIQRMDDWIQQTCQITEIAIVNHIKGELVLFRGRAAAGTLKDEEGNISPQSDMVFFDLNDTGYLEIHPGQRVGVLTKLGENMRVFLPHEGTWEARTVPPANVKGFKYGYQEGVESGDSLDFVRTPEEHQAIVEATERRNKERLGRIKEGRGKNYTVDGVLMMNKRAEFHSTLFVGYFKTDENGARDRQNGYRDAYSDGGFNPFIPPLDPETMAKETEKFDERNQVMIKDEKENFREIHGRKNVEDAIKQSLNVNRTFSRTGFKIAHLPPSLWLSMYTFWYNNEAHRVLEAWGKSDVYINHHASPVWMTYAPQVLLSSWHRNIAILVDEWVNSNVDFRFGAPRVLLQPTSIFGIREYSAGSRLMQHVDKMETHAASVIINIAQLDVREPWPLEIFDHAGRMHDVTMAEGDILYYESAKNIHSRVRPFDGGRFANLFAHYRPGIDNGEGRNILVGDDEWFTRTNPTGTIWNLLRPDTEEHAELMASTDDAGKMQFERRLAGANPTDDAFLSQEQHDSLDGNQIYDFWLTNSKGDKTYGNMV